MECRFFNSNNIIKSVKVRNRQRYQCGKKMLKRLLRKLSIFRIKKFCTYHWKIYRCLISKDKLTQSKKQTTIVESINCNVRNYLARFRRRTRYYSKSHLMVELACYFLFENHLTIF